VHQFVAGWWRGGCGAAGHHLLLQKLLLGDHQCVELLLLLRHNGLPRGGRAPRS